MTKVFVLPNQKRNQRVLDEITEAAKVSPLLLVLPKSISTEFQPPEPPMAA